MSGQDAVANSPMRMVDGNCTQNATLAPTVRALEQLWLEWAHGIGGNEPAKDFMSAECGWVKFKCSQRNNIWDLMSKCLQTGIVTTSTEAIAKIRDTCGVLALSLQLSMELFMIKTVGIVRMLFNSSSVGRFMFVGEIGAHFHRSRMIGPANYFKTGFTRRSSQFFDTTVSYRVRGDDATLRGENNNNTITTPWWECILTVSTTNKTSISPPLLYISNNSQ